MSGLRGVLAIAALCTACHAAPVVPPAPVTLRLGADSHSASLAQSLATPADKNATLRIEQVIYGREADVLGALHRNELSAAVLSGPLAFESYRGRLQGTEPPAANTLRGIAVLAARPVYVLARGAAPMTSTVTLCCRDASALLVDVLHAAYGFRIKTSTASFDAIEQAVDAVAAGHLDAVACAMDCPEPVETLLGRGVRLLSVDMPRVEAIRHSYPFLRVLSIAPATSESHAETIRTLALDVVLVSRDDLAESIVYDLTRTVLERLSSLDNSRGALDEAPATPIPLHSGSARYYREWELVR